MNKAFKLQKVLEYRELVLERETAALAVLVKKESEIISKLQEILTLIKEKSLEMQHEEDFFLQDMYRKYLDILENDRMAVAMELARHRQALKKQKDITTEAFKNKSIMDKLKEKHVREYYKYINRQQELASEDIVLTRMAAGMANPED